MWSIDKIKERWNGMQTVLKALDWSQSCLFDVLCTIIEEITEKPADLIAIIRDALDNGLMTSDFYIKDSIAILMRNTGHKFTRDVVKKLPDKIEDNWFTVEVHEWNGGNHFRRRFCDTLLNSNTVKKGHIKEYYIYKMVG